jgi:diaminopimelate epimerase
VQFSKYHGLGNDFLIVDLRSVDAAASHAVQDPAFVRAACDRNFGVGADGVLALLPATTPGAVARMRVLNADGSEAEMCGNGIRCVAKFLFHQSTDMLIDTGAGPLRCTLHLVDGAVATVSVDMGRPRLTRAEIPMTGHPDERCVAQPLDVQGQSFTVTAVSMGNPHVIAFVDSRDAAESAARGVGPVVEHHQWFPRRTNVEFAHVRASGDIDLIVWERGCGITLACGTGACATAVAACIVGKAQPGREVMVHLLGGPLAITVDEQYQNVKMRGPAVHAFDVTLDVAGTVVNARP